MSRAGQASSADGAAVKHLALDRRGRQDRPLVGRKTLETGGEKRVDRRRYWKLREIRGGDPAAALAREQPLVDEHRHELLGEERVALGRAGDPRLGGGRERRAVEQVRDQLAALRLAERLQVDRRGVELAAPPARARVEQLWPGDADEQDRGIAGEVGDVARSGRGRSARPNGGRPAR